MSNVGIGKYAFDEGAITAPNIEVHTDSELDWVSDIQNDPRLQGHLGIGANSVIKVEAISPALRPSFIADGSTLPVITQRPNTQLYAEGRGGSAREWSSDEIRAKLTRTFNNAIHESFESGIYSEFERRLTQQLIIHRSIGISLVSEFVQELKPTAAVAAEAIRTLGRFSFAWCKTELGAVLAGALNSQSPLVREAAALAMGDLDDPSAAVYLRERIQRENYSSLRSDFMQIIDDLTM